MIIGKAIKIARENIGITRKTLAELSNLSPSAITRIEKDERDVTLHTLESVANGLGLKVSELMIVAESVRDKQNEMKQIGREIVLVAQPLLARARRRTEESQRRTRK